mmetsp:Transcript_69296/g.152944  ORF Transcript_69296/g.152944 Transcript_69296/m.152944 type:complete len:238 (-) Transcript_69296:387-1100(-)
MTSSGRMPNGSSHCTPISSTPHSTAVMVIATGAVHSCVAGKMANGRNVSQMNRKRAVWRVYDTGMGARSRRSQPPRISWNCVMLVPSVVALMVSILEFMTIWLIVWMERTGRWGAFSRLSISLSLITPVSSSRRLVSAGWKCDLRAIALATVQRASASLISGSSSGIIVMPIRTMSRLRLSSRPHILRASSQRPYDALVRNTSSRDSTAVVCWMNVVADDDVFRLGAPSGSMDASKA